MGKINKGNNFSEQNLWYIKASCKGYHWNIFLNRSVRCSFTGDVMQDLSSEGNGTWIYDKRQIVKELTAPLLG